MEFKSGKHAGKSTEEVLLKSPDFAQWYLRNHPDTPHAQAFKRKIADFDRKPFVEKCSGKCGRIAKRATGYWGGDPIYLWCADCNPYSSGAEQGKLASVSTFFEALEHVDMSSGGNRSMKRKMIKRLAEAKGLPSRVGKKQAIAFFSIP